MKLAFVDLLSCQPASEVLASYKRVIILRGESSSYSIESIETLPSYPLSEDFELFDKWATAISNSTLIDNKTLSIREREAYRITLQETFQNSLGSMWGGITRLLSDLKGSQIECSIFSDDHLLETMLKAGLKSHGISVFRLPGLIPKKLSFQNVRKRLLSIQKTFHKIYAATLNSISNFNILTQRHTQKCILAYINHPDDFEFFDYTLNILKQRGWKIILIDNRLWKADRLLQFTSYPLLRLWTLGALRVRKTAAQKKSISIAPTCNIELPILSPDILRCLESILRDASGFFSFCQFVNRRIWERINPKALLFINEGSTSACIAKAAADDNIATLDLAHAIQQSKSRSYAFDALALFGRDNIRSHTERELPPETCDLLPLGACRYDKIFCGDYLRGTKLRESLNIPSNAPIICFVSQYLWKGDARFASLKELTLEWLVSALPENAILLFKKHPLEDDDLGKSIATKRLNSSRIRIVQNENIYSVLDASSVVVTMWSNAGLEAILMKKPVIAVLGDGAYPLPYITAGLATVVNSEDSMKAAVKKALIENVSMIPQYSVKRVKFVADTLTAHDGDASKRFANLIEQKIIERGALTP